MKNKWIKIRIWYLCWKINNWMEKHIPYTPLFIRLLSKEDKYFPGFLANPWKKVAWFFAHHTGGHSHRCDFTDKKTGLLHGGDGEAMNNLWKTFIKNISASISDEDEHSIVNKKLIQ